MMKVDRASFSVAFISIVIKALARCKPQPLKTPPLASSNPLPSKLVDSPPCPPALYALWRSSFPEIFSGVSLPGEASN